MPHVAPFTGAWIEIPMDSAIPDTMPESHPSRVRGLKSQRHRLSSRPDHVAPFTGAWIEITLKALECSWGLKVAPFTGAWIEIKCIAPYE